MTVRAKVIAKTAHYGVPEAAITTVEVYAPRILLAEINTHGLLARSAQSSRAVPVKRRIEMVREDLYMPEFTRNQRGMSADEVLDFDEQRQAQGLWVLSCEAALTSALGLQMLDTHKQHANRLLEPFSHYIGVITATEWDNFYALRISEFAQPEFLELAEAIRAAIEATPARVPGPDELGWHLPYATDLIGTMSPAMLRRISGARCARSSYRTFEDGEVSTPEKDIDLCEDLLTKRHMSPFDHVARPDPVAFDRWVNPEDHGRFWGWVPWRTFLERERGWRTRRNSFARISKELKEGWSVDDDLLRAASWNLAHAPT